MTTTMTTLHSRLRDPSVTTLRRASTFALPVLVLLAACGRDEAPPAEPTAPPPVDVAAATLATVDSTVLQSGPILSGALAAERTAQLRPQVGGTILALRVREGDRVVAGQSLAVIDTMVLGEQRRSALTAVRSAELAAQSARRDQGRSDTLFAAGAVAERDKEAARDRALQAQAMLEDARARLAAIAQQIDHAQVRAPFAGVVSEVPVSVGDAVQPGGSPIAVVVDLGSLELEASVPAENLGAVRPGTGVEFTVAAQPGAVFRGTVSRVNPAVDPATGQVRLYVRVPNPDLRLAVGLFAEGRVAVKSARGLSIPSDAIDKAAPTLSVKRVRGGVVESVPVTTGLEDALAGRIQVLGGLGVGDTVLVGASLGTPVGVSVRVAGRDR